MNVKELKLVCVVCGAEQQFTGENLHEIMNAIDAADWHDLPEDIGKSLCPTCWAAGEYEY